MSEDQQPTADRPRQVTMGAWVAGGCSAVMLLVVGTVIARIRSVDFRAGVTSFLAQQRDAGISMSLDEALLIIRIGLLVCGAVAAAILVFAFFAARRDRSARIAMSVLAAPMLVTGVFVEPFLAGFVVAATILLWTSPASDWYAGRTPAPLPAGGPSGPQEPTPPPLPPLPPRSPDDLPATPPAAPGPSTAWPPPYAPQDLAAPAPHAARRPDPGRRPARVLVAGVLAAAMSALMAGAMALTAVVARSSSVRADLETLMRDNSSFSGSGLSVEQVATATAVIAAVVAVWSLAAVVFAAFVIAGRRWARVALLISAGLAGLLALVSSLAFPGFLAITAATVLTGVLLLNPDVSAWYAGRPRAADRSTGRADG